MSIQSVNRIAEVSFKNHFLGTGEEKPVSGKIQVNHNTFDVTFANGRVRAKFASGNAFSNMFRSRTLSRFTERLQTQYDGWLDLPERSLGTGDISVRKQNGGTKRFDGTIALNIHILSCPSYFARDCLDKLFA